MRSTEVSGALNSSGGCTSDSLTMPSLLMQNNTLNFIESADGPMGIL